MTLTQPNVLLTLLLTLILLGVTNINAQSWQAVPNWEGDLSYIYYPQQNATFVALTPQRVTMKQNDDIVDVDMSILLVVRGTLSEFKNNPAIRKHYNLSFRNVPINNLKNKNGNAILYLQSQSFGNTTTELTEIVGVRTQSEIVQGTMSLEYVLSDYSKDLIIFGSSEEGLLRTPLGDIRLRTSDLRYSSTLVRWVANTFYSTADKKKPTTKKKIPTKKKH